jgi:hypothetical protein
MALITLINAPSSNVNTLYPGYFETDAVITCLDNAGVILSTSAFPVARNPAVWSHSIATPQYTASVAISRAGSQLSSVAVAPEDYNVNVYYTYRWSASWSITEDLVAETATAFFAENAYRVKIAPTDTFPGGLLNASPNDPNGSYTFGGYYNGYPWWSRAFEDGFFYVYYNALHESYVMSLSDIPFSGLPVYKSPMPTSPLGTWTILDVPEPTFPPSTQMIESIPVVSKL